MAKSARSKKADELIDSGSAAGAAIAAGFAAALVAAIGKFRAPQSISLAIGLEEIIRRYSLELEAALYDSTVGGYVVGASGIVAPLAPIGGGAPRIPSVPSPAAGPSPPSSPFPRPPVLGITPEAIASAGAPPMGPPRPPRFYFYPPGEGPQIKFPIIDEAFRQLETADVLSPATFYELAAEARRSAFTVSGGIREETIDQLRQILAENVEAQTSRTAFMDRVEAEVGDLPLASHHVEQVFRNNVNSAYSDGGEAALRDPIVADAFPYRAYYPIRDDRCRKEHLALEFLGLDGTNVYHKDDPVWRMFRPPWDWNCRCGWNPLTVRRAAGKGVKFAQQWLETGIEPPSQFVSWPDFLPSPSWRRRAA